MERNLTPTEKAWIKEGYEHAKGTFEVLCDVLGRTATSVELQNDSSIQETGEIVYSGTATIERYDFDSDEEYEHADYNLDMSDCWKLFDEGVQNFIDELKNGENGVIDADKDSTEEKNIDDYENNEWFEQLEGGFMNGFYQ